MPKKMRVYEVARDLRISSEALLEMIRAMGVQVKSHMSAVDDETVQALHGQFEREKERIKQAEDSKRQRQQQQRAAEQAAAGRTAVEKTAEGRGVATATVAKKAASKKRAPARAAATPVTTLPPPEASAPAPTKSRPKEGPADAKTKRGAPRAAKTGAAKPPPRPPKPVVPPPFRPSQSALKDGRAPQKPRPAPRPATGPTRPAVGARGRGAPLAGVPQNRGGPAAGAGPRRRKDRRKKSVDERKVRENIRRTMSQMEGPRKPKRRRKSREEGGVAVEEARKLQVTEFVTLGELASLMDESPSEVIAACMKLGSMATINQRLDRETIVAVADEFGFEVEFITEYGSDQIEQDDAGEDEKPETRSPVVTVMGHVDHGKTTLLDFIRRTNVAGGEAGMITQHIGAYVVDHNGRPITFLDTPGHAAFTAMRARGAQVTDIVVLVVAADDRIMPQTIEAIDHARAADVPIIVAINKIDLPGANVDLVKQDLLRHNVTVEDLGGDVVAVPISAKKGTNLDQLLDMILLVADVQDLKADPHKHARGVVLEAKVEQGRGIVGSVLIDRGTLKVGDPFVCGVHSGKVRALHNEWGAAVESAGPSVPVEVLGWDGVPQAGDRFAAIADEREANEIARTRQVLAREQQLQRRKAVTLADLHDRLAEGAISELNMIIKGDVDGSVQALTEALSQLSTSEVKLNVIHSGVGNVNESDVLLAAASDAVIIGFHVRTEARASAIAHEKVVDIHTHQVIYEAVDNVKKAMGGLLKAEQREIVLGAAEVRQTFKLPKMVVAGCYVTEGKIVRNARVRVFRGGTTLHTGKIGSLKRFKDDVREVAAGFECGLGIDDFTGIKEGDVIEAFRIEEVARTL